MPEAEPQAPPGPRAAGRLTVGEGGHGLGAHRFEKVDEGAWCRQRGDGTGLAQTGRAQLQKSVPPTRIVEVHAGDGKVEGYLLIGREVQVRQVERVAVDQVPVLFLARQADRSDRDALVAQESLVPFEGLPAGRVLGGIARAPAGRSSRASAADRC